MSKRGENIYKRKDGRWEGRYIKERSADGKARYAYVYGKSYADAKQKLLDRRIAQAQNIDCSPSHTKYGDILRNWIAMSRVHIKESTYSRYVHLANVHILPSLGELPTDKLTTQTVEKHISFLLNKGRVDKKGGLAPKTVSDILTLIKGSIDYANCSGYSVNCYLDRLTVKKTQLDMRVLSIDEQHRLCDILMRDMNLTKFGVLLCMYTGIRIGEVCALKWESIDFSEGILSIRETLQRIVQILSMFLSFKTADVETAFFGIPLASFSIYYLCASLIVGAVFMVFQNAGFTLALVIQTLILAAFLIIAIISLLARDTVQAIGENVKQNVTNLKSILVDVEMLSSSCTDPELRQALNKLADTVKYSDPMSTAAVELVEQRIMRKISELRVSIDNNQIPDALQVCKELELLYVERNKKLALSK